MYSDDPVRDFERHDREQARRLARLPLCQICGEPIQQEFAVRINYAWFCDRCLDEAREAVADD